MELISLRLTQNYQLVTHPSSAVTALGRAKSQGKGSSTPARGSARDGSGSHRQREEGELTYMLSLGTIFHTIRYDARAQNVVVTRYHKSSAYAYA